MRIKPIFADKLKISENPFNQRKSASYFLVFKRQFLSPFNLLL